MTWVLCLDCGARYDQAVDKHKCMNKYQSLKECTCGRVLIIENHTEVRPPCPIHGFPPVDREYTPTHPTGTPPIKERCKKCQLEGNTGVCDQCAPPVVSGDSKVNFLCTPCDIGYATREEFKEHLRVVHPDIYRSMPTPSVTSSPVKEAPGSVSEWEERFEELKDTEPDEGYCVTDHEQQYARIKSFIKAELSHYKKQLQEKVEALHTHKLWEDSDFEADAVVKADLKELLED
jgi:hypothetical protein